MKKTLLSVFYTVRPYLKFVAIGFIIFLAVSCNEGTGEKLESSMDTLSNKVDVAVADIKEEYREYRDDNFVEYTLNNNSKHIYLLKLGTQKGGAKVKSIAKELLPKHIEMEKSFKEYALANDINYRMTVKNIELDKMNTGAEWDNLWMENVQEENEDFIDKFNRKLEKANDPLLKDIINNYIPILDEHLVSISTFKNDSK